MDDSAERFMRMAIAEARKGMKEGNSPYGSIVVKDGKVIVKAHSTGAKTHDVAGHADMSAARKLSRKGVKGCTVYASGEPCPMCSIALALNNIAELVIGASYTDLPAQMNPGGKRPGKITYSEIFKEYGKDVKVRKGILRDEVLKLYREYVNGR